jgi:hypothetical protein
MTGVRRSGPAVTLLLAAVAACASEEMAAPELPPATEIVAVQVIGDGFVRCAERRLPLELFVLELRQRVRAMARDDVAGLRVEIGVEPAGGEQAWRGAERIVDELQVMGIRQVRLL